MPTWAWILIVVGLTALILAFVLGAKRARDRKVEQRREEADALRREAEERYTEAGRREAAAEQEALRARREREAAADAARRADDIDPDRDLGSDDVESEDVDADVETSESRPRA